MGSSTVHFLNEDQALEVNTLLMRSSDCKRDVAVFTLKTGDTDFSLHFKSTASFIEFCKEHNFDYVDERKANLLPPQHSPECLVGIEVGAYHQGFEAFKNYVANGVEIDYDKVPSEILIAFKMGVEEAEKSFNQTENLEGR